MDQNLVYYVFETQDNGNGTHASLKDEYTNVGVAWQKFHTVMAAASVSSILRHGAVIVSSDMSLLHAELAYREPPVQEG